ncbi:hypothetical protein WR25_00232 [Diploscapter pachys]|uniref:Uncharacterized protein n=1 Tax=Diploscapter pachys TaxID=2018661 RepID=A0A2A2K363_9BILA|nr:hypothetical protein WR25_00232 [Diploscapter pachys]
MPVGDRRQRLVIVQCHLYRPQCADIVIEPPRREAMQIDEVTGHVNRHQLPIPFAIVHVAGDIAVDEQHALFEPLTPAHQMLARGEILHRLDGIFQDAMLLDRKALSPPPHQEAAGEGKAPERVRSGQGADSIIDHDPVKHGSGA